MEAARRLFPNGNGSDGWLSTGAMTASIDHERQREVAGQAHSDRPDALAAKLGVQAAAERAKPVGDRARLPAPPAAETRG